MKKEVTDQASVSKVSKDEAKETTSNIKPEFPKEINGRPGPEPTRYGDWEKNGRCIDF